MVEGYGANKSSTVSTLGLVLVSAAAGGGIATLLPRLWARKQLEKVGWFTETSPLWPGQSFSLEIKEKLFDKHSKYQHVQIFDAGTTWGKVLVLDGVIQLTEKDEHAYQEMLVHVPMLSYGTSPQRVLVIGGGDGGILREVARYPQIKEIHICEIDSVVIDASKQYLPSVACGFNDQRVHVHIQDGYEFMKGYKNAFDVIIVDSSDPVGPAGVLFGEDFYRAAADALTKDGILVTQAECMWLHLNLIRNLISFAKKIFIQVDYGNISVPSYPCGCIGFLCCRKSGTTKCTEPSANDPEIISDIERITKYYTRDVHSAAFILPSFVKKALSDML